MTAPITFEDSIKEKLKATIADLIPEERWNRLVNATLHDFEKNDLPNIIKSELTHRYTDAIKELLNQPEYRSMWVNGQLKASEGIQNIIIEAAPEILAGLIGGAMQQVLDNFKYTVANQRIY